MVMSSDEGPGLERNRIIEYEVDPDVLMWGDTDRPVISCVVLIGEKWTDWMPDIPCEVNFQWWRWN